MRLMDWWRARKEPEKPEKDAPAEPVEPPVPEPLVDDDPTMTDALPQEDDETEGAA